MAILFVNNDFLRNVYQTAGQVTGVRGTKRGIRQTFTRTARGDEVFENIQAFAVVCTNRNFNRLTCGIRNQAAHTCKLTKLAFRTTRTGVHHHINGILFAEVILQALRYLIGAFFPNFDDGFRTLGVAHKTHLVVCGNGVYAFLRLRQHILLLRRDGCIANRNGNTALGGVFITLCFNLIKHFGGNGYAVHLNALVDDFAERLFVDEEFDL